MLLGICDLTGAADGGTYQGQAVLFLGRRHPGGAARKTRGITTTAALTAARAPAAADGSGEPSDLQLGENAREAELLDLLQQLQARSARSAGWSDCGQTLGLADTAAAVPWRRLARDECICAAPVHQARISAQGSLREDAVLAADAHSLRLEGALTMKPADVADSVAGAIAAETASEGRATGIMSETCSLAAALGTWKLVWRNLQGMRLRPACGAGLGLGSEGRMRACGCDRWTGGGCFGAGPLTW
jgi:hypothetical protein